MPLDQIITNRSSMASLLSIRYPKTT